jgi:hypothetical protein
MFSASAAMRPALAVLALSSLLIGCSTHPIPDDISRKSTYDIVDKIRCEAKAAVEDFSGGQLSGAHIAYTFTFDILEKNDANLGATFTNPLKGGSVGLDTGLQSKLSRQGVRTFELLDSFDDLRKMNCTRDREKNWLYPLTGDVGLYDSVGAFIRLQQAPGATSVVTFADTLKYTTTFTGGVNASVALAPLTDQFRLTAASAAATSSRTDMHKLVVTMAAEGRPVIGPNGPVVLRRTVPFVDVPMARFSSGRNVARRNFRDGDPSAGGGGGSEGLGVAGGFNNLISTRMLQQDSSAANRVLYEQDRQRQLELQRRATDVRVLVGP